MRIHTDHNGLHVNAISSLADGTDVEGHQYDISAGIGSQTLYFQYGTIPEAGLNGITNEALLAIIIHRIRYLNGKFPCRENSLAITKAEECLLWLEARTKERMNRGVEGKHAA